MHAACGGERQEGSDLGTLGAGAPQTPAGGPLTGRFFPQMNTSLSSGRPRGPTPRIHATPAPTRGSSQAASQKAYPCKTVKGRSLPGTKSVGADLSCTSPIMNINLLGTI